MANEVQSIALSGLSKRQQAIRRETVGGSEVSVLAGVSRWSTPIGLYEAKVMGLVKEQEDPMLFGIAFEEPVAQIYAAKTGRWLRPVDTLINGKYPLACATPDRAVFPAPVASLLRRKKLGLSAMREAERGLEIKTTTWRSKSEWGPEGSDIMPLEYECQVQWCMGITGVHQWDVGVMFDRDSFRVLKLQFDAELFESLYELAARFMRDHVIPKRPPPVDYSQQYEDFLNRRWQNTRQSLLVATHEMEALGGHLARIDEVRSRLDDMRKLTTNKLREMIADASGIEGGFGKIYWRQEKDRTVVDHKAALEELRMLAGLAVQTLPAGDTRAELEKKLVTLMQRHTTTRPGNRPLKLYASKALKAHLRQLDHVLERIPLPEGAVEVVEPESHNPQGPEVTQ